MRPDDPALAGPGDPCARISPKSYGVAVSLSAVFGFLGIQHFYLGRVGEGLLDVGLSMGWLWFFASGEVALGALCLAADGVHALVVTILLLTGNFRDGQGRIVCYPGQRLAGHRLGMAATNHSMRRGT